MQDAFAYCAERIRTADRDRFLAALYAPAERRDALYALYAFNVEIARVREAAREPMPGEIRLQWWREVLGGERQEEARANPIALALLAAIERHRLDVARLVDLIDARGFDLYDVPMAALGDLETYAQQTHAAIFALAARILSGNNGKSAIEAAASSAGIACVIADLLHAFPRHAARSRLYVPVDLLARHQVAPQDIFAGQASAGLRAALGELRDCARLHLAVLGQQITALPQEALPAFLPAAIVRPMLDRLNGNNPFAPIDLSPWRRQWLIWRAARSPARIAT